MKRYVGSALCLYGMDTCFTCEVISLLCMSEKICCTRIVLVWIWIHVSVYVCVSVFDRGQGVSVYREGE